MNAHPATRYRSGIFFILCAVLILAWAGTGLAINPANPQEQPGTVQPPGETVPSVPGARPERPVTPQEPANREIVERPRPTSQVQSRFADTFLPKSVWHVTDPQDGVRQDGRVAVLEGANAQVVYQFYPDHKILNVPDLPDLTIHTHDKGGFDGPYNVFVASFGAPTWTQLGMDVVGTSTFDLPPNLESAELVLIINRHEGASYIEAVEGVTLAGGPLQGTFSYFPEHLIGLRVAERLDCAELERARTVITQGGMGYQLAPLGELEVLWNSPIKNEWKTEEFLIEAEGEYEIYASDSRGIENFIGRRAGTQGIDLPQDMLDAARVRIRNHNGNRPIVIYSIAGRR